MLGSGGKRSARSACLWRRMKDANSWALWNFSGITGFIDLGFVVGFIVSGVSSISKSCDGKW